MTILVCQPEMILNMSHQHLGLESKSVNIIDDSFLASIIRYCAGFLCPCSAVTIRKAVLDCLQYLCDDQKLPERIDETIECLIVGGDLLNLHQKNPSDGELDLPGNWLYSAPPGFVVRKGGSFFITGVVPDYETLLPSHLAERIQYEGYSRVIQPLPNESLEDDLNELGFHRNNTSTWLNSPIRETSKDLISEYEEILKSQGPSGFIQDLQIIEPEKTVRYYPKRWKNPEKENGVYIGRRPQEYGSPIWCIVFLDAGEAKQLLDLPLPKERWRGCDIAWLLQMAIDCNRGEPQLYRVRVSNDMYYLDFFSPIPLWAERRLMFIGQRVEPEKCLLSYLIPESELKEEELFLQENLWLKEIEKE